MYTLRSVYDLDGRKTLCFRSRTCASRIRWDEDELRCYRTPLIQPVAVPSDKSKCRVADFHRGDRGNKSRQGKSIMSEGRCESQPNVPDPSEPGTSSDRENPNRNSLTPSSDVDLNPSIEELIERIKILALETPRPHNKLPRAPFPTPAKASPDGRAMAENLPSSSFAEDGQELGLRKLKKAIEIRFGAKRLQSPGRSSSNSGKHIAVDNKLLATMLTAEHQRRQRMEWDLEVERADQAIPVEEVAISEHQQQHHQPDSILSPKTRSVVSDASVHVTKGSPCSEIDSSSELEKFQQEGDSAALFLEYSLREVSEVFSVFVKCNKWMLRSRMDSASPVNSALDKRDLVGADIFRQAVDISFADAITCEQRELIYDSYMRTIDTSQGQLEEVLCDDSRAPVLPDRTTSTFGSEGERSREGDKRDVEKEEAVVGDESGDARTTSEEEKMGDDESVHDCSAYFRTRLSLKFNKREEWKEEEEENRDPNDLSKGGSVGKRSVDYSGERTRRDDKGEGEEKEYPDEIFASVEGGERLAEKEEDASKEEMKSTGRRKWRSLSEYGNESSSTPINEESRKRRTFSESDVLNASLFISDDFLSEDYIRKLERSVSLVNEISSNVSEDLARSDTSAKFLKEKEEEQEEEEEEEEKEEEQEEEEDGSSDDLAKCSRRESSRSTSSTDSVDVLGRKSDKTRKFQLNLREEDEQESLPDSTKCTMDSNSVNSDNLSLDLDDVYDTIQRPERIPSSCAVDAENRREEDKREERVEIGEFGSLSDSLYFTPPADQASSNDKPSSKIVITTDSNEKSSKGTDSCVKECDDDVFEDVGSMKPCERRNSFHSFLNRILFKQKYATMKESPNESKVSNEDENKNTLKLNIVDDEKISKTKCGRARVVPERCRPGNLFRG